MDIYQCTHFCATVRRVDPLPSLTDDGLVTPPAGDWGEDKYQLVKCYASIFASSMKYKWECLVYIDLFAGAGRAKFEDTGKIVPASPLVALEIPDPFTRYIFCEKDEAKLDALRKRVAASFPASEVEYIPGDCNANVEKIIASIPVFSRNYRVLTFCFVDPYNLGSLSFSTLERLAHNRLIDFLVLIASGMDANRNRDRYTQAGNTAVTSFVGSDTWRSQWPQTTKNFGDFVADQFGTAMERLGYIYDGLPALQLIRSTEKNLALYHLGVFSKHIRGAEFWQKCRQAANPQRSLFS
jgi:three-Cys-motif partner protein